MRVLFYPFLLIILLLIMDFFFNLHDPVLLSSMVRYIVSRSICCYYGSRRGATGLEVGPICSCNGPRRGSTSGSIDGPRRGSCNGPRRWLVNFAPAGANWILFKARGSGCYSGNRRGTNWLLFGRGQRESRILALITNFELAFVLTTKN